MRRKKESNKPKAFIKPQFIGKILPRENPFGFKIVKVNIKKSPETDKMIRDILYGKKNPPLNPKIARCNN